MAKVTCELNNHNLVLLENANLAYVDGRTNVINTNLSNHLNGSPPLACPNGCKNGLPANVNSTCVNSCLTSLPNSHCPATSSHGGQLNGTHLNKTQLVRPHSSLTYSSQPHSSQLHSSQLYNSQPYNSHLSHLKRDDTTRGNLQPQIPANKTFISNSIYLEVVKSNRFKDRKANLSFPRKFVNVQKKECNEDGLLKGTKQVTKTCVLQPSLFENIPPTIYFGLEDELSRLLWTFRLSNDFTNRETERY